MPLPDPFSSYIDATIRSKYRRGYCYILTVFILQFQTSWILIEGQQSAQGSPRNIGSSQN